MTTNQDARSAFEAQLTRNLTEIELDRVATLLNEQERGDLGFQGLVETILSEFGALAQPDPATPEQSSAVAESAEQRAVPAGWRMVPVEPTEEMKAAAVRYANGDAVYKNVGIEVLRIEESIYGEVYEAMLSAAPAAQQAAQSELQLRDGGE